MLGLKYHLSNECFIYVFYLLHDLALIHLWLSAGSILPEKKQIKCIIVLLFKDLRNRKVLNWGSGN